MDVVETDVVIEAALSGKNIIVSGSAGTGKSTLTREIIKRLEADKKRVIVVAPTGLASSMVGGATIHKQFGLKPGGGYGKPGISILRELSKVDVIVIDEISMVRADIFDYMDMCMKEAKPNSMPFGNEELFGGTQIICVGDLHQLCPVLTSEEKKEFVDKGYISTFFFDAKCFVSGDFLKFNLTKNWRQSSDTEFVKILEDLKYGKLSDEAYKILKTKVTNSSDSTHLCSFIKSVDARNSSELAKVKSQSYLFKARITGFFPDSATNMVKELTLKKGAKVIMVNNDAEGRWHNGSTGHITNLVTGSSAVSVEITLDNGDVYNLDRHKQEIGIYKLDPISGRMKLNVTGTFEQFPLKLGYALSIHASQGQTYDKCHIDFGRGCFSHGQAYVALSRCRSLAGITLEREIKQSDLIFDSKVIRFLTS